MATVIAGTLVVAVEHANGIKEVHWKCRQDPYCVVRVEELEARTRSIFDGGRNPVWNQKVQFCLTQETKLDIVIKNDCAVAKDEVLGVATLTLDSVRQTGKDQLTVPVLSCKSHKQHGTISVSLTWRPCEPVKACLRETATEEHKSGAAAERPHQSAAAVVRHVNYAAPGAAPIYAAAPPNVDLASHLPSKLGQGTNSSPHQFDALAPETSTASLAHAHMIADWRERHQLPHGHLLTINAPSRASRQHMHKTLSSGNFVGGIPQDATSMPLQHSATPPGLESAPALAAVRPTKGIGKDGDLSQTNPTGRQGPALRVAHHRSLSGPSASLSAE